jgi:hypothetical protein
MKRRLPRFCVGTRRRKLGPFDDALLAYAVTTDELEAARQTEREERVKAAKRTLLDRALGRTTEDEAPAP